MKCNISKYFLWSAIGVLFAANIVWSIIFLSTQNSVCDPEQDDIQMCQEQIDRLSYIISLSAEMAVLRKEKGDMKELEILLRQIVDQITANVIANSIYEFDGKGLVKFDLMNKIFKELVDAKLLLEKSQGKAKPKLLYPAQMVHDEKFDYLTRKNSDSRTEKSTTHESENLRPNDTNNKNTNKTNKNYCNYEQRQYTKEFFDSLYANLVD